MTHAPQLRPAKLPQGLPGITKITRYTREMDASWRALKLILAAALLQSSSASVLNVTTPEVEVGKTANVSLECFNPNPAPGISDIVMIRILKWHHDEWNSVAELQRGDDEEVTQTSDEVSTEGTIGSVDESFLRLTWPVATNNTLGRYRCDFVSLTLQESVMWQKSVPIFVRRKRVLTVQMLRETVEKNKRNGFQQLRSQKQDLLENITATGELLKAGFESLLESELQVLNKTVEENKNDLDLQNQDIENVKASVENSTRELLQLLSSQNQEIQENLTATIEDLEEGFGNQIQVRISHKVQRTPPKNPLCEEPTGLKMGYKFGGPISKESSQC
ncbi:uncharacterized protein LOC118477963 [Aplysia californica]|uniref:Uncharacterized protein LOC118477963 n=1 Tax=Aplysia californica TaxID=6500 RepID=A0ABM1VW47_APLCA|nr:uncharacterized protein LOC118477963 [Aplysia californica]